MKFNIAAYTKSKRAGIQRPQVKVLSTVVAPKQPHVRHLNPPMPGIGSTTLANALADRKATQNVSQIIARRMTKGK